MSLHKTTASTWLQLLRAPNLFTVPGDPLAGYLLASNAHASWTLPAVILASLCFYSGGLLLNDLADLEEDRRERPHRPLPSGLASVLTVRIAACALAVIALLLCALVNRMTLFTGLGLLCAITLYNVWSKKIAVLGPLNMGLCRGLSLLLGASAWVPFPPRWDNLPPAAWSAAAGLALYITLVTHLARIETQSMPPKLPRTLPYCGLILAIVPFFFLGLDTVKFIYTPLNLALYGVSAYALYAGYKIHTNLLREPAPPIPPMIGQLIRMLLPLQAIWCLGSQRMIGGIAAAVLLVLWPISRNVSRRFYAS